MYTLKNQHGFTILELLISLTIMLIVLAAVCRAFSDQHKTYVEQEEVVDMQQNLRVAIETLARDIRMAGCGTSNISTTNQLSSYSYPLNATNSSISSDSLTVIAALNEVAFVQQDAGGNTEYTSSIVYVDTTSEFDTTNNKYVFFSQSPVNYFYTINNVNGATDTITLSSSIMVIEGEPIILVRAVTYALSGGNLTVNYNAGGGTVTLVENVDDMQFEYGLDTDNDGDLDDTNGNGDPMDDFVNNPAGNEDDVRAVRIHLLVRGATPDPAYTDDGMGGNQYTLADHTINLDTNDGNGMDSTFDWHYHRRIIECTVKVRNMAS